MGHKLHLNRCTFLPEQLPGKAASTSKHTVRTAVNALRFVLFALTVLPLACTANNASDYKGPIEGQIPEDRRRAICEAYDGAFRRVEDEAEIKFPNASSSNSVVHDWKIARLYGVYAVALNEKFDLTPEQSLNILAEGQQKGWCFNFRGAVGVATDRADLARAESARADEQHEKATRAYRERVSQEEREEAERKKAAEPKKGITEDKRPSNAPGDQKKDEPEKVEKKTRDLEKAEADRLAAAMAKKREEERIAAEKAAKDRMEQAAAQRLALAKSLWKDGKAQGFTRSTAIEHLNRIIKDFPGSAAAKEASELLKK
jgi:hypothetical protein